MSTDLKEVRMLKYTILGLIFIMGSIITWNSLSVISMPNNYVRLERYNSDRIVDRDSLKRIERKLDHLINKN